MVSKTCVSPALSGESMYSYEDEATEKGRIEQLRGLHSMTSTKPAYSRPPFARVAKGVAEVLSVPLVTIMLTTNPLMSSLPATMAADVAAGTARATFLSSTLKFATGRG